METQQHTASWKIDGNWVESWVGVLANIEWLTKRKHIFQVKFQFMTPRPDVWLSREKNEVYDLLVHIYGQLTR